MLSYGCRYSQFAVFLPVIIVSKTFTKREKVRWKKKGESEKSVIKNVKRSMIFMILNEAIISRMRPLKVPHDKLKHQSMSFAITSLS